MSSPKTAQGASRPPRVLLFCEKWESGGVEAFVTSLIEAWGPAAVDVTLAACKVQPGPYDRRLAALGVTPVALGTGVRQVGANLRAFRRLLARGGFDAVHLNIYEGLALLFARAARKAGVPRVVVHSHNDDLRPSATRALKLALHRACRACLGGAADVRLAPSQQAGRFMFGNRPFTVVLNGIDPQRFAFDEQMRAGKRAELGLAPGELALGCVGRLCQQKNQRFLLDVLAALKARTQSPMRLLLVGEDDADGSYEAALREQAGRAGLLGEVTFCGRTSDVVPYYQAMDVLCMPSTFEALGIVAVEAQAAGLPVVASARVPAEAHAGGEFTRLPLVVDAWADAVLAAAPTAARRRDAGLGAEPASGEGRALGPQRVVAAGYDMRSTAARVLEAYKTGADTR